MSTKDRPKEATIVIERRTKRPPDTTEHEKLKKIFQRSKEKQQSSLDHIESDQPTTKVPQNARRGKLKTPPLVEKEQSSTETRSGRRRAASTITEKGETPKSQGFRRQSNDTQAAQKQAASETAAGATNADAAGAGKKAKVRIRLFPIWLRVVIVFILMVFFLAVGTMVGYGVIGDGKPVDALKQSTWLHIVDLINKEK